MKYHLPQALTQFLKENAKKSFTFPKEALEVQEAEDKVRRQLLPFALQKSVERKSECHLRCVPEPAARHAG